MCNIGENTVVTGWTGSTGTLRAAFSDRNLHRNTHYDYFGPRVQRGSCELLLRGEWRTVRFDVQYGWARKVEVL